MKPVTLACIIDDDDIFVFGVKRMIQRLELSESIVTFSNGENAISWISDTLAVGEKIPEVILLDINMPIMDGWEFLEELSKLDQEAVEGITIYMISSSVQDSDSERAKQISSVHNFFVKPVTEDLLKKLFSEAQKNP